MMPSGMGQAKEASKEYAEAAKAYERARDTDNVVRLLLEHLNQPERASALVRETRTSEVRVCARALNVASVAPVLVWRSFGIVACSLLPAVV